MLYQGNELTNIVYYTKDAKDTGKFKECNLYNEFVFKHNTFVVVGKNSHYHVCISKEGELIIAWSHLKKDENGNDITVSEIMSIFRKRYLENNITDEMIDLYLNNPVEFKKKYKKKKNP